MSRNKMEKLNKRIRRLVTIRNKLKNKNSKYRKRIKQNHPRVLKYHRRIINSKTKKKLKTITFSL